MCGICVEEMRFSFSLGIASRGCCAHVPVENTPTSVPQVGSTDAVVSPGVIVATRGSRDTWGAGMRGKRARRPIAQRRGNALAANNPGSHKEQFLPVFAWPAWLPS
jgi:hypothetical protein